MTAFQLEESANAPWTRTMVGVAFAAGVDSVMVVPFVNDAVAEARRDPNGGAASVAAAAAAPSWAMAARRESRSAGTDADTA